MSTTFNGFELLSAIGASPAAFASAATLVEQTAPKIVFAALKHKDLTLPLLIAIKVAIGSQSFDLALDNLGDGDLKKILKKIDAHWPGASTEDNNAWRDHIVKLVEENLSPSARPEKRANPTKAARTRGAKAPTGKATLPSAMVAKPRHRTGR